jgi:hypothetical protein
MPSPKNKNALTKTNHSLTDDEKITLKLIFKKVEKVIVGAQLSLFLDDPAFTQEEIVDIILMKLRPTYTANIQAVTKLPKISLELDKKIPEIVRQIVSYLFSQKQFFCDQLQINFLQNYAGQVTNTTILYNNQMKAFEKYFPHFIRESLNAFDSSILQPTKKIKWESNFSQLYSTYIEKTYRDQDYLSRISKGIYFSTASICIGLLILYCYREQASVTNLLFFAVEAAISLSVLAYYFFSGKQEVLQDTMEYLNPLQNKQANSLQDDSGKKLNLGSLHELEFIDLDHHEERPRIIYTPISAASEIKIWGHEPEQLSVSKTKSKPKKVAIASDVASSSSSDVASSSSSSFPPPLRESNNVKFSFRGEVVLGGDAARPITQDSKYAREIYSPGGSTGFVGFFNKQKLQEQLNLNGLEKSKRRIHPNYVTYKDYKARWDSGRLVAPREETGIKQLKPQYKKRLDGQEQASYFVAELKTINKTDRCLGRPAGMVIGSDNKPYTLIDFCYHMPKGPGK